MPPCPPIALKSERLLRHLHRHAHHLAELTGFAREPAPAFADPTRGGHAAGLTQIARALDLLSGGPVGVLILGPRSIHVGRELFLAGKRLRDTSVTAAATSGAIAASITLIGSPPGGIAGTGGTVPSAGSQ